MDAGKCGKTQNGYEPPGGTSEQRVICDVFCELCSREVAGVLCANLD